MSDIRVRSGAFAFAGCFVGRVNRPRSGGIRDAGFTLVEMLVALVVAGVLAAAVLTLLLRQDSFYGQNDDTIYAEQTLRGTAELVASELRMASPGTSGVDTDFLLASPDTVEVRSDVSRAVVCGNNGGSTIYMYVYDESTSANLPGTRGTAVSAPDSSAFQYDPTFDPTVSKAVNSSSLSYTTCVANNGGVPQSADLGRYRSVDWSGSTLPVPVKGSVVRIYGILSYGFAPSSFSTGTALWRNDQELVAPFASGAKFEYVMQDGSVQTSVTSTSFPSIRRIRIDAQAIGSGSNRYDVSRSLTFDIPLRNL